MKLQHLALTFPLLLATATGAIAQEIPTDQQRSPAGKDSFPYRPACSQLSAVPGGSAGWLAWGPVVDGAHQNWKGMQASIATDTVYRHLAAMGLCVEGGAIVPLSVEQVTAAADEDLTPMERNIRELKAKANGDTHSGDDADNDGGFGSFMLLMLAMFAGVHIWERFEDRDFVKKFTGNSPKTFDHLPPSFEETTIPDRVSPEDLEDLRDDKGDTRSALDVMVRSPFVSRAIFGFQRTGKTNMVAMGLQQLSEKYSAHAYVINLNAFTGNGEQDVYWQGEHITAVLGDLENITDETEAQGLIDRAAALVDAFTKHHGPAILVVDEWSGTTASHATYADILQPLVKKIAGRVTSLASTGVQREKAVWTIAPEMVAETMDAFGKAVKKLPVCLVAIAPGHVAKWKTTEITFSSELLTQVRKNYPGIVDPPTDSEQSRIAYIDGAWRELGTRALVKVDAVGAEVSDMDRLAAAKNAIAQLPTTEDNLPEDLKLFREWLDTKVGEVIAYESFKNASKFKSISRARDTFDALCDKSCMKGWLKQVNGVSDALYQVIK